MSDGWRVSEGAEGTVIVTRQGKEIARLSERAAVKVRQGEAFLLSGGFSLHFTQIASMKGSFYVQKDIATTREPDPKKYGRPTGHIGSITMAAVEILKERQHLGENSDIFPGKSGHSKAWRDRTLDECAMLAIELHNAIQRILAEMEPK